MTRGMMSSVVAGTLWVVGWELVTAAHSAGTDLAVDATSPLASPTFDLAGTTSAAIATRVVTQLDTARPGLRRARWTVEYRGGFTREVGATQLVGPFQDPAAPACSGRIVVGQRLLDDGRAGPDTMAGVMAGLIDAELRGENIPVQLRSDRQRVSLDPDLALAPRATAGDRRRPRRPTTRRRRARLDRRRRAARHDRPDLRNPRFLFSDRRTACPPTSSSAARSRASHPAPAASTSTSTP